MCGFVVSVTEGQSNLNKKVGKDILSRGEDYSSIETIHFNGIPIHFEFSHLFITSPQVVQPLQSMSKILVLNGEIYNYQELAEILGLELNKFNDVGIFFEYIERYGLTQAMTMANGMYSGVLLDKSTGDLRVFTDHVGKKPLLVWNSSMGWHIGTGVDTDYIDIYTNTLDVISPGVSKFDIKTGVVSKEYLHQYTVANKRSFVDIIESAIALRIPNDIPFAVALSGGLDSSIIAYILEKRLSKSARYYVVADSYPDSVLTLLEHLKVCPSRVVLIKPPTQSELLGLIKKTCEITKSYNPSIISNGLATLLLSKAVQADGIRVLLSGEGADEYFCGYQGMYNDRNDPEKMRACLIENLHYTELRRLDLITASHSIEARCPFLDNRVTQFALTHDVQDLCDISSNVGKTILRDTFKHVLPNSIIHAPKEPFDITSGLQKMVIDELKKISTTERTALRSIFEQIMDNTSIANHHYFSHYPTFDTMIERRELKYKQRDI